MVDRAARRLVDRKHAKKMIKYDFINDQLMLAIPGLKVVQRKASRGGKQINLWPYRCRGQVFAAVAVDDKKGKLYLIAVATRIELLSPIIDGLKEYAQEEGYEVTAGGLEYLKEKYRDYLILPDCAKSEDAFTRLYERITDKARLLIRDYFRR